MSSRRLSFARYQRGATLIVGLIMLVLITLMVTSAFILSNGNLKAVGNMQFKDEAVSAANTAIEKSFGLSSIPVGYTDFVDIGAIRYTVAMTRSCLREEAIAIASTPGGGSSVTLGFSPSVKDYFVLWDYDATVTDSATGTTARVRQGIHQRLSQTQCDTLCAPGPSLPCS